MLLIILVLVVFNSAHYLELQLNKESEVIEQVLVTMIVGLIGAITTLFKTIKFVHEGELGIRLRFGRVTRDLEGKPKIIRPGFVLLIPFMDTLKRHHVRQQTVRLYRQTVMIQQGLIFEVSAIVIFRVRDIYRALFEIDDLNDSILDISMGILRELIANKEYSDFSNMEEISSELLMRLRGKAEEWGVEFIQFKLIDCSPTKESAPLINAKVGVQMKLDALKKAAGELQIDLCNFPHGLAAALVGVPLVVSVDADRTFHSSQDRSGGKEKKPSGINFDFRTINVGNPSSNNDD